MLIYALFIDCCVSPRFRRRLFIKVLPYVSLNYHFVITEDTALLLCTYSEADNHSARMNHFTQPTHSCQDTAVLFCALTQYILLSTQYKLYCSTAHFPLYTLRNLFACIWHIVSHVIISKLWKSDRLEPYLPSAWKDEHFYHCGFRE